MYFCAKKKITAVKLLKINTGQDISKARYTELVRTVSFFMCQKRRKRTQANYFPFANMFYKFPQKMNIQELMSYTTECSII